MARVVRAQGPRLSDWSSRRSSETFHIPNTHATGVRRFAEAETVASDIAREPARKQNQQHALLEMNWLR